MTDKEKIRQLEEELAHLKRNPSAKFYAQLVAAIEYVGAKLEDRSLNLAKDAFAASVTELAVKAPKMFEGLQLGLATFEREASVDEKRQRNVEKSKAVAL